MTRWSWVALVVVTACSGEPEHASVEDPVRPPVVELEPIPAAAREAAEELPWADGCFDVSVGEWRQIPDHPRAPAPGAEPPGPDFGAMHWLPRKVRLSSQASDALRWEPKSYDMENLTPDVADPELWGPPVWAFSSDTLFFLTTTGYDGSVARLVLNSEWFVGINRPWTDDGGEVGWERSVRLDRVSCPSTP